MTAAQMGELLGLKKTERYWLIHKDYFETKQIAGKIMVDVSSFEKWYANQVKYRKVCGTEPGMELRKHSYSARDISILLGIHEQAAYDLIYRKGLKTILVDGWKRVPVEEFETWFNSQSRYKLHDFSKVDPEERTDRPPDPGRNISTGKSGMDSNGCGNKEAVSVGYEDRDETVQEKRQNTASAGKAPPGYYSRREAAALAGVSELTIITWAGKGHFPQRKAGNRIYIPKEAFETWVEHREEGEGAYGITCDKKREV